ncbi:hypothetical protein DRP04_13975 [Archaeoglobales archaeon]|nr:MAG: hypothetical protein DRP04_13975 [Archaeoglobales archaeon]
MNPQWVIELLKLSPTLILIFIVIYLLLNPEKAEKWGSLIYKGLCYFSSKAEKRYIALNIQGSINSFQKEINRELEDLLPYGVKIDWVSEDVSPESFITEGKVVIRLGYHKNQDENVIRVVSEYISKALIPEIKPYLSEEIRQAIDFSMIKRLLYNEAPNALNRFYDAYYKPEIENKPQIKDLCEIIEAIDSNGWFTRIFLRELKELGTQFHSRFPDPDASIDNEVRDFLQFLYVIATKKPGEDVKLNFDGEHIKVAIILVARAEASSIDPHKKRILGCIQTGIKSIYLSARGANVELARWLIEDLANFKNLVKIYEKEYKTEYLGKKIRTICVKYIVRESSS